MTPNQWHEILFAVALSATLFFTLCASKWRWEADCARHGGRLTYYGNTPKCEGAGK